jgi:hypothetical protein
LQARNDGQIPAQMAPPFARVENRESKERTNYDIYRGDEKKQTPTARQLAIWPRVPKKEDQSRADRGNHPRKQQVNACRPNTTMKVKSV